MRKHFYFLITFVLFILVLSAHVTRILYGWEFVVAGVDVPLWISWWVVSVTGLLSFIGLHLYNQSK